MDEVLALLQKAQKLLNDRQDEQSKRMDTHWVAIQGLLKIQNAQAKEISDLTQAFKTLQGEVEQWLKR